MTAQFTPLLGRDYFHQTLLSSLYTPAMVLAILITDLFGFFDLLTPHNEP